MNARPDDGRDALSCGAGLRHEFNSGLQNAGKRSAPARMCCADDARNRIRQEHRGAVGRDHAERESALRGDHCIGLRPLACPWTSNAHGRGRVDLVHAEKAVRRNVQGRGDPTAILCDGSRIVPRAGTSVEARVNSSGHPALAAEESVRKTKRRRSEMRRQA
jgi:hypothetical protein